MGPEEAHLPATPAARRLGLLPADPSSLSEAVWGTTAGSVCKSGHAPDDQTQLLAQPPVRAALGVAAALLDVVVRA